MKMNDSPKPRDKSISLQGAVCLAAVAWFLFSFATISCVTRAGLRSRPLGGYGGECISSVGDDCMSRLVHQQQRDDIYFLLSVIIGSAIPAWALGWGCYQLKLRSAAVLRWASVGVLTVVLSIAVFPVAYALAMLDSKPVAALQAVKFIRSDPKGLNKLTVYFLDDRVLALSKTIIASNDGVAQSALAQYASSGQPGEEWRNILLKLADGTPGREQALICLGWRGDRRNLEFLGKKLLSNDDAVASVPYQLMAHYGKEAVSYVQDCVTQSPNIKVRFACARELVLKGKPEGFKFYLDNLDWNRGRRGEILEEMRDYIPGGRNLRDEQLPAFLAEHAGLEPNHPLERMGVPRGKP